MTKNNANNMIHLPLIDFTIDSAQRIPQQDYARYEYFHIKKRQ